MKQWICVPFTFCSHTQSPIKEWDVSVITDMKMFFKDLSSCNPHINNWDVSAVEYFVSNIIIVVHIEIDY